MPNKPLVLLEPSYIECNSALEQLADLNTLFILTYRPVLDRIISHVCMDISLGILPHPGHSLFKCRLDERIYYYLFLSDFQASIARLKYILKDSLGSDIVICDLSNRLVYHNGISDALMSYIAHISSVSYNIKSNLSRFLVLPGRFINN